MKHSLKITFLGTGTSQGIPIIGSDHPVCLSSNPKDKRLRSSIMISWDTFNFVIDCGPDFRQQMLFNSVPYLNGILFTHEHSDHTAGLDDIRPFYFRQGDINMYAYGNVIASLKKRFDYIFATENRYPGAPVISVTEFKRNDTLLLADKKVTVIEATHGPIKVHGFRIQDFTYLTDVKSIDDEQLDKIKNTKVLVVNALRIEEHYSHFNLDEALAFVAKVKPQKAYFTHISHLLGFHDEVEKNLPKNVHLAYDNLKLTV